MLFSAWVIFNKKLQLIRSLTSKFSLVHLRLFRKVFSAACRVWKIFLSVCELMLLALTVMRACNSCALQRETDKTNKQENIRCLSIDHLYYFINDIFCHLLFRFSFKSCLVFVFV